MTQVGLDHFQIAIPVGREDDARSFYRDVLGLQEIAKPADLVARGGLWFALDDGVGLHLGVDPGFHPATRAHPGLMVDDLGSYRRRLADSGFMAESDIDAFGRERLYVDDPFGNRVELIGADADPARR